MLLLDTHAWIWSNDDPGRLSQPAREAIEVSESVGVAAISCWEVGMLAVQCRLTFQPDVSRWVHRALRRRGVVAIPLSPKAALDAALLEEAGFVADPADRMIYATAVDAGATLITRDARIREFDPRGTLW